jgi:TRAP-type transport system periplasmic protein
MKKQLYSAFLGIGLVCLLLSFGVNVACAETIELKFAHPYSPMHPQQQKTFMPWAKKLEAQTNGKLKIKFIPGGALGKPGQAISVVERGIADITFDIQDYTPGRFPLSTVMELPFMIKGAEKASVAFWKTYEAVPALQKEYEGVKVLSLMVHSPGGFTTVKTPIRTLDDLKGLKMRTASALVTKALKLYGSIPVTMPITEVYTSLERNVVDGTVLIYDGITVFKLDELLKYVTAADFYTMDFFVVMNEKKYNSLPADVKKVLDANSGLALSRETGRINEAETVLARDKCLAEGMEEINLSEAETKKFVETTMPLRQDWIKEMTAKGLPGQQVYDTAIKFLSE